MFPILLQRRLAQKLGDVETSILRTNLVVHHRVTDVFDKAANLSTYLALFENRVTMPRRSSGIRCSSLRMALLSSSLSSPSEQGRSAILHAFRLGASTIRSSGDTPSFAGIIVSIVSGRVLERCTVFRNHPVWLRDPNNRFEKGKHSLTKSMANLVVAYAVDFESDSARNIDTTAGAAGDGTRDGIG